MNFNVGDDQTKSKKIQVVVTVGMVGDLVKRIGGDQVDVIQLCGPGVDPHLYKATRDDVLHLLRADIVFYSGNMLEGKLADSLNRLSASKPVVAVAEQIPPEELLHVDQEQNQANTSAHRNVDPHVWMDASLWKNCLVTIAKTLGDWDPPHQIEYLERADQAKLEFDRLHEYGQQIMATVPLEGRVLITSHDAFGYFGRAYGLEVLGVQGISTESEGGLQQINNLVNLIVERGIKAVFVESSVSRKSIDSLVEGAKARGQDVKIGSHELFSDAMGANGTYEGTYIGMLDHNLTWVARDLGGHAPELGFQNKLKP